MSVLGGILILILASIVTTMRIIINRRLKVAKFVSINLWRYPEKITEDMHKASMSVMDMGGH